MLIKKIAAILAFSAAALVFNGTLAASAPASNGLQSFATVTISSSRANQNSVENIFDCPPELQVAYDAAGLPKGQGLETIRTINSLVQSRSRYRADRGDVWVNNAAKIIDGGRVSGDCEDMVITAVTLGICAGIPASKMSFAFSKTRGGAANIEGIDHAVAIFTDGGTSHIFADTSNDRVRRMSSRDKVVFWQTAERLRLRPGVYNAQIDVQKYRDSGLLTAAAKK